MQAFSFKGGFTSWAAFGIPILTWIIAAGVAVIVSIVLDLAKHFGAAWLARHATKTKKEWDELVAALVRGTKLFFIIIVGIFIGSLFLRLPADIADIISKVVIVVILIQAVLWINRVISFVIHHVVSQKMSKDPGAAMTVSTLGFLTKLLLFSVVLIVAFENIGINVTALIAGLGIGGVAVALAAQNVLGDLFASLSIVIDKPFVIGDNIIIDDFQGTVEHIGLKTTRIRSLSGEQIVISNNDLLKSRIRNYKRMYERRVQFNLAVAYQTPHEKLLIIPKIIREAVEKQQGVRFDRAHFNAYGDSALLFEAVYIVTDPDYNRYMDTHQAINLHIFQRFAQEKIEFAYPTRTLYVKKQEP
jgi:small-conductance mechanosensitive channel